MTTVQVEWIGVRMPTDNDRVSLNQITGQYNDYELATLEAVGVLVAERVRQPGTRKRRLSKRLVPDLSKSYEWGPTTASYTQPVTESDARIIFALPCEYEFKRVGDPEHADRVPIVPPEYIDEVVRRILAQADKQGPVVLSAPVIYNDAEKVLKDYEARRASRHA